MIYCGLSGGIGSGKSTVAGIFASLGAYMIDSDATAREVVAPGSEGLELIIAHFGPDIVDSNGELDRKALAARIFADDDARQKVNSITHPRIAQRTAQRIAQAPADAIIVHETQLLVELNLAPMYHLVMIVDAPVEVRLRRLVEQRAMSADDVRSRMKSQASAEQRRAVGEIWINSDESLADLNDQVKDIWYHHLVPFQKAITQQRVPAVKPIVTSNQHWPSWAGLTINRLHYALRELEGHINAIEHIGSTAVPGLIARDCLDIQITLTPWGLHNQPNKVGEALERIGYVRDRGYQEYPQARDSDRYAQRYIYADKERQTQVTIRSAASVWAQLATRFPHYLSTNPDVQSDFVLLKGKNIGKADYEAQKQEFILAHMPRIL